MYGRDYPDVPTPDPNGETLDGVALLESVDAFLARFVAFPSDEARHACVLWAAHTHALTAFETTPRLALLSPEPGSGKTRALEILEHLVLRPLLTVNVTPAYLFRKVADEAGPPTLLYDEIDTVFGPKAKDNEDIRGMLNAGYRRGATAGRCVIKGKSVEVEELPAFAAVALAGLDDLPDTIMTRSIVVRMRRRAPHELVDSYRRRVHEAEGHALRDDLAAWASSVWSRLEDAWPDLPDGIEDRNADVWEPLLAMADAAGGRWPDLARVSAVSLVSAASRQAGGLGIRLLDDVRAVFGASEYMATDELLDALHALDEAPWNDLKGKALDARGLAYRLGKYGIGPSRSRPSTARVTGATTWSTPGTATSQPSRVSRPERQKAKGERYPLPVWRKQCLGFCACLAILAKPPKPRNRSPARSTAARCTHALTNLVSIPLRCTSTTSAASAQSASASSAHAPRN
jgi:hypothetical protein